MTPEDELNLLYGHISERLSEIDDILSILESQQRSDISIVHKEQICNSIRYWMSKKSVYIEILYFMGRTYGD